MTFPDNDAAISRWRGVFRDHGFDDYDIDFSGVEPDAIEAMALALQSVAARRKLAADVTLGVVRTFTGRRVDLANPDPDTISFVDIAHAHAHDARYGGHGRVWYSVAEHVCLVHSALKIIDPQMTWRVELAALLHDAPEAYIRDMPAPAKRLMPGYQLIEASLERCIASSVGLKPEDFSAGWIKTVDRAVRPLECALLFGDELGEDLPDWLRAIEVQGWEPEYAERELLTRIESALERRAAEVAREGATEES